MYGINLKLNNEYPKNSQYFTFHLFGYIFFLPYRFPSPPIDIILCYHLFKVRLWNFIRPLKLIYMEFLTLLFLETN